DVAALASFRDVIAISAIVQNRALDLLYPRGHRILFGDAFGIYPWVLDKHDDEMVGCTPAILRTNRATKFRGQSSPALFRTPLHGCEIDQPIFSALLERWRKFYERSRREWPDIALFRSLNMAYHASLLPTGTDTTFYDVGRLALLWVSAFEILVHPGG